MFPVASRHISRSNRTDVTEKTQVASRDISIGKPTYVTEKAHNPYRLSGAVLGLLSHLP